MCFPHRALTSGWHQPRSAAWPPLTALSISTGPQLTPAGLLAVARAAPQLQRLELHEVPPFMHHNSLALAQGVPRVNFLADRQICGPEVSRSHRTQLPSIVFLLHLPFSQSNVDCSTLAQFARDTPTYMVAWPVL